jgi:hypothetical protein
VVLNADRAQLGHDVLADPVVDDALALQDGLLGGVEGGGVVLEVLDQRARFRPLVEDLGLAFVDLLAARHVANSPAAEQGRRNEKRARSVCDRARVRLGVSPGSQQLNLANGDPWRKRRADVRPLSIAGPSGARYVIAAP